MSTEEDQGLTSTEGHKDDLEATAAEETNETMQEPQEAEQGTIEPVAEAPTMSPEHVLLLQVLRRGKRQQELISEVQKSLKALATIDKSIGRTTEQIKQLQSIVKDTQKQIIQTQRQIASLERAQIKGFQKMAKQKAILPGTGAKVAAGKRKKNKSKRKR